MKNKPSITVLMPAYNAAPYIREAIDSVLAQTFGNFELLIINDGSTDETEDIIRSYRDERIRLYRQENSGVIGALNSGLDIAAADLIARFDADDICYPNRLQVQYDYMNTNPECVLVGSASDYIDKDGAYLFEWQPPAYEDAELKKILYTACPFDHPATMYRKDVAINTGKYPAGAIHFEDHLFWTQFIPYGTMVNLRQPLIKHRFNPQSVTIDEKWRGKDFTSIRYRSIAQGFVSKEDHEALKQIVMSIDEKRYKDAAYYSMIGKKYLWNNPQPAAARAHFRKAISILPFKAEPYLLYLLSFLPTRFINAFYRKLKK